MSEKAVESKIRIKLSCSDRRLLERSAKLVLKKASVSGARVSGPIPLPTKKRRYTVLRSPHVDKKSREQFEIRVYRRILDVYPNTETVAALMALELPPGVDVEVQLPR